MARIASRWGLLAASLCAALTRAASAPAPIAPPMATAGATVHSVADDLVVNGRRCRIDAVEWPDGDVAAALARYRAEFGARHVERQVRGVTVIAGERDGVFETVQLRPTDHGVSATVLSAATDGGVAHSAAATDAQRWLPPDTAVLQTLESRDDGRPSLLLTAANTVDVRANRDQLAAALQSRGWRLDREEAVAGEGNRPGVLLAASSAAGEAIVSIGDAGAYRTVLIQRTGRQR